MRGCYRQPQNRGPAPSPGLLRNPTSPRKAERGYFFVVASCMAANKKGTGTMAGPLNPPVLT